MSKEYTVTLDSNSASQLELHANEKKISPSVYIVNAIKHYNNVNQRQGQVRDLKKRSQLQDTSSKIIQEMKAQQDSHLIL